MGRADLHIHTNASDGRCSVADIVEYAENHTKMNVIAITDHDTIKGALEAVKIVKKNKYKIEIIVGEEITSKEGHIIGLFLKEAIKPHLSVHETLKQIKEQGGIATMPHPLYQSRMHSSTGEIADGVGFINLIKERDNYAGIETINATPFLGKYNVRSQFLNRTVLFKSEVGGSDTHILKGVGKGYTIFPGTTALDLKNAIIRGKTQSNKSKWGAKTLVKYAISFLPNAAKVLGLTLVHGRSPKKPQIINCRIK